jgi:hypothetical protein
MNMNISHEDILVENTKLHKELARLQAIYENGLLKRQIADMRDKIMEQVYNHDFDCYIPDEDDDDEEKLACYIRQEVKKVKKVKKIPKKVQSQMTDDEDEEDNYSNDAKELRKMFNL